MDNFHPAGDRQAVSPDGKWVAYESNEAGREEIYVVPYPGPAHFSIRAQDDEIQMSIDADDAKEDPEQVSSAGQ